MIFLRMLFFSLIGGALILAEERHTLEGYMPHIDTDWSADVC